MATRQSEEEKPLVDTDKALGIARAFVAARQSGGVLTDYPGGEMPQGLAEAYSVQSAAIGLFDGTVSGWKVGRIPDALVDTYGTNRLAGPIFADTIVEADGGAPDMKVFGDGFAAAEAEYLLRLGTLPESFDRPWNNDEVAAHVDAVHVGIEIASSPFTGINKHGPAVTISDFGNNNGLVIGEAIDADAGLLDWPVSLAIDGEIVGEAKASAMLDGPFGAVRFLFEMAGRGELTLREGQWISTGAVTGVHEVRPGATVVARFGESHRVECGIVAIDG